MPKYGVHTIVLSEAIEKLASSSDPFDLEARSLLLNHPGIANLGAIGPDIFFWAPDYEIIRKLYRLYSNIAGIIKAFNDLVQPMKDLVDATVDVLADTVGVLAPGVKAMIEGVIAEVEETKQLFDAWLTTGLFDGVVEGFNFIGNTTGLHSVSAKLFNSFKPPLQDNLPVADWYWFDMLHYRRTGDFARNLVVLSEGSPIPRAFAYGYLSHIATDVLGHSFVNQIVGGPYRTQVQRHITAESFIDAWEYSKKYQQDINQALFQNLNLPESLPPELITLLYEAFQKTYAGDENHPHRLHDADGFLTQDQIAETYAAFYQVFKWLGNMAISRPTEPFSNVAEILADIFADVIEPPPSPPETHSTHGCGWRDIFSFGTNPESASCYDEFFDNVADYITYLGELVVYALETFADIWNLLTASLAALPVSIVLALLYALQLLLYDMYMTTHEALALEGFVMPYASSLDTGVCRRLITPVLCCGKYPRMYDSESNSHLVCPGGPQEQVGTIPGFHPSNADTYPEQFIRKVEFNPANLQAYAQAVTLSETQAKQNEKTRIGNAVAMSQWMIAHSADPEKRALWSETIFANWNLDADRGYAYKTWHGAIPSGSSQEPVNEDYV